MAKFKISVLVWGATVRWFFEQTQFLTSPWPIWYFVDLIADPEMCVYAFIHAFLTVNGSSDNMERSRDPSRTTNYSSAIRNFENLLSYQCQAQVVVLCVARYFVFDLNCCCTGLLLFLRKEKRERKRKSLKRKEKKAEKENRLGTDFFTPTGHWVTVRPIEVWYKNTTVSSYPNCVTYS